LIIELFIISRSLFSRSGRRVSGSQAQETSVWIFMSVSDMQDWSNKNWSPSDDGDSRRSWAM